MICGKGGVATGICEGVYENGGNARRMVCFEDHGKGFGLLGLNLAGV